MAKFNIIINFCYGVKTKYIFYFLFWDYGVGDNSFVTLSNLFSFRWSYGFYKTLVPVSTDENWK